MPQHASVKLEKYNSVGLEHIQRLNVRAIASYERTQVSFGSPFALEPLQLALETTNLTLDSLDPIERRILHIGRDG